MKIKSSWKIAGVAAILGVITYSCFQLSAKEETAQEQTFATVKEKIEKESPKVALRHLVYGIDATGKEVIKGKVRKNQNLSEILGEYKVDFKKIHQLVTASDGVFDVRKIQAEKDITVICEQDSANTPKCMIYAPDDVNYVIFHLEDSVFVEVKQKEIQLVEKKMKVELKTSLYNAVIDAGGSPEMVNKLADVYAWQIDFFGIQKGDWCEVVYEEKQVEGKSIGVGDILAANFYHAEEAYQAYLFEADSGRFEYFDEQGNSLRKAFLKAPLKFSRVSSRFSYNRLHPVLKIRRPHLGVDYAAPTGTPVVSIGDGVITKRGYFGGAGNMLKVKHNSVYTSGYLHLHRFAKGIRTGSKVKQGQLIGYVGSTGLSTGPHLDFRVWKHGKATDPLELDPPSVEPVAPEKMAAFEMTKNSLMQKLTTVSPKPAVAMN